MRAGRGALLKQPSWSAASEFVELQLTGNKQDSGPATATSSSAAEALGSQFISRAPVGKVQLEVNSRLMQPEAQIACRREKDNFHIPVVVLPWELHEMDR